MSNVLGWLFSIGKVVAVLAPILYPLSKRLYNHSFCVYAHRDATRPSELPRVAARPAEVGYHALLNVQHGHTLAVGVAYVYFRPVR